MERPDLNHWEYHPSVIKIAAVMLDNFGVFLTPEQADEYHVWIDEIFKVLHWKKFHMDYKDRPF